MADFQISDMRIGTVTLTNTKQYPFNDSVQTVALETPSASGDYAVLTEVISAVGEAGDIVVSGRAVNGFKLAFTGSAEKAVVRYRVIGETGADAAGSIRRVAIPLRQSGTVFSFGGGALTLDLSDHARDYPVTLDICADASGAPVLGPGHRYIAQISIPARAYTIGKGPADDFGFPKLKKTAAPIDMEKVTLRLWAENETGV